MPEPKSIDQYVYVGSVDGIDEICDFIHDNNAIDNFFESRGADPGAGIAVAISVATFAVDNILGVVNIAVGSGCVLADILENSTNCNNLVIDVYVADKYSSLKFAAPVVITIRCEGSENLLDSTGEIANNIQEAGENFAQGVVKTTGDLAGDVNDFLSSTPAENGFHLP